MEDEVNIRKYFELIVRYIKTTYYDWQFPPFSNYTIISVIGLQ
jgi:hypothetical protein